MIKLGLLLLLIAGCGGEEFTSAALTVAPPVDDDAGDVATLADGANEVRTVEASTPDRGAVGPDPGRDVLADPWPDDVVVERAAPPADACTFGGTPATGCPCINCFIFDNPDGTANHTACCDGSGNPNDAATDHLCNQGDFPTPHKGYCASCGCQ